MKIAWQLVAIAALVAGLFTGYVYIAESEPVVRAQRVLESVEREVQMPARRGLQGLLATAEHRRRVDEHRRRVDDARRQRNIKVIPGAIVTLGLVLTAGVLYRQVASPA